MNMVQSSREVSLKRKPALMIDEGDMHAKMARLSPPYYVEHNDQDKISSIVSIITHVLYIINFAEFCLIFITFNYYYFMTYMYLLY